MSLNAMLKTLFGALSIVIMSFLAINAGLSWNQMQATQEIRLATYASSRMFVSLANLRTDASMTRGLLIKDEITTTLPQVLTNSRGYEVAALADSIETLKQIEIPQKEATIAFLSQSLNQLKDFQQQSNSALALPKASRPADLQDKFTDLSNSIMDRLQVTGAVVKHSIQLRDPVIEQLIHLHNLTWDLRVLSGTVLNDITNNIVVRGNIPTDAKLTQANAFGRLDLLKETIKGQMENLPPNPDLAKAMTDVESLYFDPAFRALQVASLDKLMASEKLSFTRSQWDNDNAIKVNAIRDLAVAFIDRASKIAEQQYQDATRTLTISVVFLIAATLVSIGIIVTIRASYN